MDDDHSLVVYHTATGDWTDGAIKSWSANDKNRVLFAAFTGGTGPDGCYQLVTGGIKHIKFWKINSRNLSSKKGLFGKVGKIQPITNATVVEGKVVTGTSSGDLYVWEGHQCASKVAAHSGPVSCASSTSRGGLITGGKDGKIILWDNELSQLEQFELSKLEPAPLRPVPVSVAMNSHMSKIVCATLAAEIYEISVDSGSACCLVQGHYNGELWGLACHPVDPDVYATTGDDKMLRVWSLANKGITAKVKLGGESRALAFSPDDGRLIAAGLNSGGLQVFEAASMDNIFKARHAKEWISDVKFSPDAQTLAVASHDNNIYLYSAKSGDAYDFYGRLDKHNSYVTHMDFSSDGQFMRSTCGAYELLFYKVSAAQQLPGGASELKDVAWHTETCPLGWGVQGIWPEGADGTDINAVDRYGDHLATADDFGKVRIFAYPVLEQGAPSNLGTGHSSHVTNVRFNCNDSYLISVGGNDKCVFQWKLQVEQ
uniref:Anaphase-promoting complex subunit 4 WD40 domain-containing protein n=2 Tax=Fibrocapsa japonica TaxID=94617 RepID=A0A7S2V7Z0_9STRA